MRPKPTRERDKVWAAVDPEILARINALIDTIPEGERERKDSSRADVIRAALALGLTAMEKKERRVRA